MATRASTLPSRLSRAPALTLPLSRARTHGPHRRPGPALAPRPRRPPIRPRLARPLVWRRRPRPFCPACVGVRASQYRRFSPCVAGSFPPSFPLSPCLARKPIRGFILDAPCRVPQPRTPASRRSRPTSPPFMQGPTPPSPTFTSSSRSRSPRRPRARAQRTGRATRVRRKGGITMRWSIWRAGTWPRASARRPSACVCPPSTPSRLHLSAS